MTLGAGVRLLLTAKTAVKTPRITLLVIAVSALSASTFQRTKAKPNCMRYWQMLTVIIENFKVGSLKKVLD